MSQVVTSALIVSMLLSGACAAKAQQATTGADATKAAALKVEILKTYNRSPSDSGGQRGVDIQFGYRTTQVLVVTASGFKSGKEIPPTPGSQLTIRPGADWTTYRLRYDRPSQLDEVKLFVRDAKGAVLLTVSQQARFGWN